MFKGYFPHTDALNVTEFTFEAWAFLTETTGCKTILSKGPRDVPLNNHGGYLFGVCDGEITLYTAASAGGIYRAADSILSTGTWYHVAASRGPGDDLAFYLNGVEDGTYSSSYTPYPGPTAFHIGRYPGYPDE